MSTLTLELEPDLAAALQELDKTPERAARELIVLELYRRGSVSSGRAAELLQMSRHEFIRHASQLGIPYLALSDGEWAAEVTASGSL